MKITLFHTTDLHARVESRHLATNQRYASSLAQLSTTLKNRLNDAETTLLVDTGDFLQGSPITAFCYQREMIHPVIQFFNDFAYDVITLGNHEFDYHQEVLTTLLAPLQMPVLAANLQLQLPDILSHTIVTKQGVRFLIIGLTIPCNEQHYAFSDVMATLKAVIASVPKHAYDCLVCCYHGGFQVDPQTKIAFPFMDEYNVGNQLLAEFPEIDILLTGHQHQVLTGWQGQTFYSQAGCYTNQLVELALDFEFQPACARWQLVSVEPQVHHNEHAQPDLQLQAALKPVLNDVAHWLETPLRTFERTFPPFEFKQAFMQGHPLIAFIHDFQKQWGECAISAVSIPQQCSLKQTFTRQHVYEVFAYEDTLVALAIKGDELVAALQRLSDFFVVDETGAIVQSDVASYFYDVWSGIQYTFDFRDPLAPTVEIQSVNGEPFCNDATYRVVMNAFRAYGGGLYPQFQAAQHEKKSDWSVQTLFSEFLAQAQNQTIESTIEFDFQIG